MLPVGLYALFVYMDSVHVHVHASQILIRENYNLWESVPWFCLYSQVQIREWLIELFGQCAPCCCIRIQSYRWISKSIG